MTSKEKSHSLFSSALYLHGSIPLHFEGQFLESICKELYAPDLIEKTESGFSLNLVIEEIIDKLNKEKTPLLCGYSMGGRILQFIVPKLTYTPELIVLMSSALPLSSTTERKARLSLDISRAKNLQKNLKEFLDSWYSSRLWSLQESDKNEIISVLLSKYGTPEKQAALAKLFTHFSPGKFPHDESVIQHQHDPLLTLRQLPLIYFYGEFDLKYKDEALKFKELNPGNKTYEISKSGHKIHFLKKHQELILQIINSTTFR